MFPKPLEQFLSRGAENAVNLVDLVQLVCAWEQREQTDYFEEHAADTPDVHLIVVVTVCQQTFRRSIPACRDVLGVGLFAVDAAARTKVGELQHVVRNENVLLRTHKESTPQQIPVTAWLHSCCAPA